MRTTFYILLRLRTAIGFEAYGTLNLGENRELASRVFSQLKGRQPSDSSDVLHLDFIETKDGLPVNLDVLSCTAEEMAANIKCVTKEMFKHLNLGSN